jgi:hypothetical protein
MERRSAQSAEVKRYGTGGICVAKHVNRRGEIVDDLVFNEQQKRKRAPKPKPARMIPQTSCCGTCDQWTPPMSDTPYGFCASALAHETNAGVTVMLTRNEAKEQIKFGDVMRCAASFVCSQYQGEYDIEPIAARNVEFKTEVRTLHDLIQEDRGEWEWPA